MGRLDFQDPNLGRVSVRILRPKQTDTPVQIRRARNAFIRARQEEDVGLCLIKYTAPLCWPRDRALAIACQVTAEAEYARAVCHALQYLLAP